MQPAPRARRFADRALIGLFLLAVLVPGVRGLTRSGKDHDSRELRSLAEFPSLGLSTPGLNRFTAEFEKYFNDRLGGREFLLSCQATAKADWLRVSPTPQVIIGRHGWLYLRPQGSAFEPPAPEKPFAPQARKWLNALEDRRLWLAD